MKVLGNQDNYSYLHYGDDDNLAEGKWKYRIQQAKTTTTTTTEVQVLQNETGREADRWKLNNLTDTKKSCEASTTTTYTVHFMWLIKALSDIVQT